MDNVEKSLMGAWERYKARKFDDANKWVNNVLTAQPFNIKALQLSAMIAKDQGDIKTALDRIMTALSRSPEDPELFNVMGGIQAAAHDPMRAEMAYRMAIMRDMKMVQPRHNLAYLLMREHMPHLALEEFDVLIALQPENAQYKIGRIVALKDIGRHHEALEELDALGGARMGAEEEAVLRCQLAILTKDYSNLAANARRAMIKDEPGSRGINLAAQGLALSGDHAALYKFLEEAKSDAKGPLSWASIARAYRLHGKITEAVKTISEGIKAHPNDPDLLTERAEARLEMGQAGEAFEAANSALSQRKGDLNIMPIFARSALAAKHPSHAQIAADEALKRVPNHQFWWAVRATGGRMNGQNYKYYYDYETLVRPYTLPIPKGYKSLPEFNAALKSKLEELHQYDGTPLDQSLRLGTQTGLDLRFVNDPIIQAYFEALDGPIRDYMGIIGDNPNHILSRRNSGHYRLSGAWSVKLKKDGFHVNHVHPQGWISSAYYVDVPDEIETGKDKAGWIGFGQPPADIADIEAPEHFVKPEAGKLVLFPSYMWHGTVPIKGDATRLTLPFDVVPAPPPIQ